MQKYQLTTTSQYFPPEQLKNNDNPKQKKPKKSKSKSKNNKSKGKNKTNRKMKMNITSASQQSENQEENKIDPLFNNSKEDLNNSTLKKATGKNINGNTPSKLLNNSTLQTGNLVERQVKLNFFMRKKVDNSSNLSSTSYRNCYAIPQYQRRQASLERQLNEKQRLIQKLKSEKQINLQKYTKLKMQSQQIKINNKRILEQQMRQSSRLRRLEKAEINPKMGYYKQASWTMFIEGDYITYAKKKVQTLENKVKQLEEKKRNSRQEERDRLMSQIDYLNKENKQALIQLKNRQVQLTAYKERLRLSEKQSNCTLAKSNWPLIEERYLPLQLLGSGGFGEVYKCYDLDNNNAVAIKTNCFEPTKSPENRHEFIKHVQRQILTLKSLNHPNIAKLYDQILINDKISFVLEYCTGPQLNKYLSKRQFLDQKQSRGIIKQVSFALKYMFQQKHRIIHYDLKPANIIFHNGCVKLLDFGLCKRMETEDTMIDLTSQGVGTYWYLPPETFRQSAQISSKVDVWSLGVIFYELLYGKRPFGHGVNQSKIYQDGIILKAIKVEFPSQKKFKVSQQAKEFIRQCLKYNSEQRLDPIGVYEHPYLSQ